MLRRKQLLSALAVAVAVGVAGCSAQPGTAAVVNGTRITEAQLDDATLEYVDLTGQPAEPSVVLNTLIAADVFPAIAAKHGLALSDQQVEQRFEELAQQQGAKAPEGGFSPAFIDLGHYLFAAAAAQSSPDAQAVSEEFSAAMAKAKIEVNPRYGEVTKDGAIQPIKHDWIAQTTPQPTPQG